MATIALYAGKVNQMPSMIESAKKAVVDYNMGLSALKTKTLTVDRNIMNLDDVVSSIQASSQTQEQKISSLETFKSNTEQFISDVVRIVGASGLGHISNVLRNIRNGSRTIPSVRDLWFNFSFNLSQANPGYMLYKAFSKYKTVEHAFKYIAPARSN